MEQPSLEFIYEVKAAIPGQWGAGVGIWFLSKLYELLGWNGAKQTPKAKEQLGDMGMVGIVYRGRFKKGKHSDAEEVVIRRIPEDAKDFSVGGMTLEQARREHVMARVHHTNVLQLLHIEDEEDGHATFRCFVFEKCWLTLEKYAEQYENFRTVFDLYSDMDQTTDALYQMASGLKYIHSKGLVHGNIKPSNIVICNNATGGKVLKLSDFGHLNVIDVAAMKYAPPELQGKVEHFAGSPQADVFCLGKVFDCVLSKWKELPHSSQLLETGTLGRIHQLIEPLIKNMLCQRPESRPAMEWVIFILSLCMVESKRPTGIGSYERGYGRGDALNASYCAFHPTKPILACVVANEICLFVASDPSIAFHRWTRKYLQPWTRNRLMCVDWNADGSKLAAGCQDGTLLVWKWTFDGLTPIVTSETSVKMHSDWISCVKWNRQKGKRNYLVTGGHDKKIITWHLVARQGKSDQLALEDEQTFESHDVVKDIVWIQSKHVAFCDGSFRMWRSEQSDNITTATGDAATKATGVTITEVNVDTNSRGKLICFDVHQRGNVVIAGGMSDSTVRLWQFRDWGSSSNSNYKPSTQVLKGHSNWIVSVAFSPRGDYLAAVNDLGEVIIWAKAQEWKSIYQKVDVTQTLRFSSSISWDPSGKRLAIVNLASPQVNVIEFDQAALNCINNSITLEAQLVDPTFPNVHSFIGLDNRTPCVLTKLFPNSSVSEGAIHRGSKLNSFLPAGEKNEMDMTRKIRQLLKALVVPGREGC